MKAIPSEHRRLYLDAIHAGRAEAERLGYGLMDDRIFSTFFRALYQPLLDLHERELREQAAAELIAWADTFAGGNATQRRMRRHIHTCAQRVAPKPTPGEVLEALARGDFVACLDEPETGAGQ